MSKPRGLSTDEFHELGIGHLLGELDEEGRAAFAAELIRHGAEGAEAVRRLERTLGDVALAAAPAEPPPTLRSRVLAALPADAKDPAAARATVGSRLPWQAAVAIPLLAAAGLGIWAVQLVGERNRLRGAIGGLEARAAAGDDARAEIGALRADLDALRAEIELAGAPGSIVYGLAGTLALPQAGGRVFVDTIAGRALLLAGGLPRLEPDQSFELWSTGEEGTRSVAVFRPDDRGRARREIVDLELLRNAHMLTVTVEPLSGAAQPTGEIVLSSDRF